MTPPVDHGSVKVGGHPSGLARNTERQNAHRALTEAAEEEYPVPCQISDTPGWWISDDPEQAQQAAGGCAPCPLLDQCRAYGLTYPEPAGVYGGLTVEERRRIWNRMHRRRSRPRASRTRQPQAQPATHQQTQKAS